MGTHLSVALLLQRAIGSRVGQAYREFVALYGRSVTEVEATQERRLEYELRSAVEHVEFYRQRVAVRRSLDLRDFPILTKDCVRAHFDILCNDALQHSKSRSPLYGWVEVSTGGSTGVPLRVIHGANYRDRGRAARLFSQLLSGFPFGTPYLKLWGSMKDIDHQRVSAPARILRRLSNEIPCNAFLMDHATMDQYLEAARRREIRHMMAYVDAAHELARYVMHKESSVPMSTVMACAGQVTDAARRDIAHAFGARVHNKYGSRECADMACECSLGGFHIYSPNVVLEVVDDSGTPLPPRAMGRLLVTLLGNPEFPLIRYEIGDMAALSNSLCDCGLQTKLLHSLEGRRVEWLRGTDGNYVSPVFVRHLIGVVHNDGSVRRYQVIQESASSFRLLLEFENDTDKARIELISLSLKSALQSVFGPASDILVERVSNLNPSDSGKFLYCINRSSPVSVAAQPH
jgi:phenylacetate-CoA ligase